LTKPKRDGTIQVFSVEIRSTSLKSGAGGRREKLPEGRGPWSSAVGSETQTLYNPLSVVRTKGRGFFQGPFDRPKKASEEAGLLQG